MTYPWLATFAKRSDAQQAEVERLANLTAVWTNKIRKAFLDAVARIASDADVDAIAELLRQGRAAQAIEALNAALLAEGFEPVAIAVSDAAIASGKSAADVMSDMPGLRGIKFSFGVTNPQTIAQLQTYEFGLIRQLTATARASVAQAVRIGVAAGRNPLDTARDIRAAIGLTDRQTQAVANFRRALEEAPTEAMNRALRDKRFDPSIASAIRSGAKIPQAKIDVMVERYHARYLKYRSEVIGRTESIRAVNVGNVEAWRQQIRARKIRAGSVTKRWIYTRDDKTRHAHRTIPALNRDDPDIEGKFKSEYGPIAYPGDPEAPAKMVCNCRCTVVLRFKGE